MRAFTTVIYDERRESKRGFPFKLRITFNRNSDYISLKLYMTKDEYAFYKKSLKKQRVPAEVKEFRQQLIEAETKANQIINQLPEYNFDDFKEKWTGNIKPRYKRVYLSDLFTQRANYFKSKGKINTALTYENALNALNRYKPKVKIKEVKLKFLEGFHNHLLSEGKSITTISIHMRTFRAVLNANRQLINEYPFTKYQIPSARNNKRAIPEQDMKLILDFKCKSASSRFYLDLYRFSFYCAGINIRDITLLKNDNIKGNMLTYNRSKTGKSISIHLLDEAKSIIRKYQSDSEYLFPILKNDSADHIYKKVNTTTNKINYTLKKICEELEIPKVSTYSARHSFATMLMNKEVSLAFISQSLGHCSIATTQSYLGSFTDAQMKENMEKLLYKNN